MATNNKKSTAKTSSKTTKKTTKKSTSAKSAPAKPTKAETDKKKALQGEVLSIIFIGLSLMMLACVITSNNTGTFGHYISNFLIRMFGIGATALPVVLLIFSIQTLFSDQKSKFKIKLFLFLGFFIVFISLAHILTRQDLSNDTLYYFINYHFEHASLSNGGILGAIIGGLLYTLLGNVGASIVLITALLVLLILATGKSIVSLIGYIGDIIDGVKDEYQEYKESIAEEDESEEIYEDEYSDDIDNIEQVSPKKKSNPVVEKKPRKVKEKPVKEKKSNKVPKNKAKKSNGNEKLIAFSIPEEEVSASDDSDILFENDFILKNNEIFNKPYKKDAKYKGLNDLVNEVGVNKANESNIELDIPQDEAYSDTKEININIPNFNDYVPEDNFDTQQDNTQVENTFSSPIAESYAEDIADSIVQNTPDINNINSNVVDDLPWEEDIKPSKKSNDEIAVQALKNINNPCTNNPNKPFGLDVFESNNVPEIIEAEKTKTVNKLKVDKVADYKFPKLEFLAKNPNLNTSSTKQEMIAKSQQLENTLHIFGVEAKVNNISQGPAVTRYELTPPKGVRVKDIVNLENDIALALAARSIRMEAPIPGKSAIGIEIPNDTISMVYFREVLTNEKFQNFKGKLAFGIGKDITGNVIVQDIAKMPHLLIAGSTGSGKSVCINTLITSILYKYTPDQVKLIMVDPKIVELGVYNGIPHLLIPVVTDPQKAAGALNWAVNEMMRRYDVFATKGVRNLEGYNNCNDIEEKIPQIVVIIDELADLMMVAKKDVESSIQRLTQLARAAGIHLVIATQRPSVNVITGVIKANVPSRIAFKVASSTDSRTILDASGAEKLLGKGDMLFQAGDMDKPLRIQGAFVTDSEIEKIVSSIKVDDDSHYDQNVIKEISSGGAKNGSSSSDGDFEDSDELINDVIKFVTASGKASTSLIQRKFRIGFNRAARIIDELEDRGIIGPDKGGTKGRDVLMSKDEYRDWNTRHDDY